MSSRAAIGVLILSFLTALGGCSDEKSQPPSAAARLEVVATIFPLADVARQIGGPSVNVGCLLRAGQSPHDFSPQAEQAEMLARARLLIMVGLGVDEWAGRAAAAAKARGLAVLRLAELGGPDSPATSAGQADSDHVGHERDPHVWLDPVQMRGFAADIAEALSRADPEHRQDYLRRRDAYVAQLEALDREYRTALAPLKGKAFLTFHPAFSYMAERYGLKQFSLHTADAAGFGPDRLDKAVAFIRANRVRAIFAEPQFPAEKLRALADQTGAAIGRLDPLGSPASPGYDSYLALMRSNLQALAGGLKE